MFDDNPINREQSANVKREKKMREQNFFLFYFIVNFILIFCINTGCIG